MLCNSIPNFFAILNNALVQKKFFCKVPSNTNTLALCSLFFRHGYILGYREMNSFSHKYIYVTLKTAKFQTPLNRVKLISRGGNNVFWRCDKLHTKIKESGPLTQFILSTRDGFLFAQESLERGIGGKILCQLN